MGRILKQLLFFFSSLFISISFLKTEESFTGEQIFNEYKEFRDLKIESGNIFLLKDFILKKDVAEIKLNGKFFMLRPFLNKDIGGIFVGSGSIAFSPLPPIEKMQLKRFTGKENFEESFTKAIFFFSDDTSRIIKENCESQKEIPSKEIVSYWNDFAKMMHEKRKINFEARFLAGIVNVEKSFTMYFETEKHGKFIFSMDPMEEEEISLVNYSPEDFYDIWCSFHLKDEYENTFFPISQDKHLGETLYTKIYVEIDNKALISGNTKIRFKSLRDGIRMLIVSIAPSLRIESIKDVESQELKFIQEDKKKDSQLWVIFNEPLQKGKEYELTFFYKEEKGDDTVIEKTGESNFFVSRRTSWFPNFYNFKNKCRYEMTFKVPEKFQVIATGKLIKKYKDGDTNIWEFDTEIPFPRIGFSYGKFISKIKKDEKITLECFANPEPFICCAR